MKGSVIKIHLSQTRSLDEPGTGPRSAVGNVSGYRCVSDCRSRGREFDPGPIPYFRGDWSWNNFLRSFSSLPLIYSRRVVVSYKRKYVHKLLVNRLLKPAQEKSVVKWTDRPAMTIAVDMGRKATKTNKQNKMNLGNNSQLMEDWSGRCWLVATCLDVLPVQLPQ